MDIKKMENFLIKEFSKAFNETLKERCDTCDLNLIFEHMKVEALLHCELGLSRATLWLTIYVKKDTLEFDRIKAIKNYDLKKISLKEVKKVTKDFIKYAKSK